MGPRTTTGRQPLQPLATEAAPARRRPVAPPTAPPARRRGANRFLGPLVVLLVVAVLAVLAIVYMDDLTGQGTRRDYNGDMQQTFDDLRDAINDYTR